MLRPQDGPTRERRPLDDLWSFRLDPDGVGREQRWFAGPIPDAISMAVPASYNDLLETAEAVNHVGDAWYQTQVWVPRGWDGQRITLYLESATHRATVWLDDTEVAFHEGGYTPFEADLTEHVRAGHHHRVTIAVDNRLTWQSIPPGIVLEQGHRTHQQYWHDFYNYAGLHRRVWLTASPQRRIEDVTVVTDLDNGAGLVGYRVDLAGEGAGQVVAVLRDADGAQVASAEGAQGTLVVPSVHRWEVGQGYLYELEVQLEDGTALVDSYRLKVGVRTVEVAGNRFLVNGEPVYFKGFGMHEDHDVVGKAHIPAHLVHDFRLLEWIGANSFRTSHYPYSEDVMDYADARGFLVIDEVAAVGQNMGIAGGIWGGDTYQTFSPETVNDESRQVHAQAIRELIARDKNHPCVVLWSIANEPESDTAEAEEYFGPLFEVAREADPTRPVGFVNVMLAPHGACRVSQFGDVIMLNRYYGWYADTGDLAGAELHWLAELGNWSRENKPIIITEYGADTIAGQHAIVSQPWDEEYQTAYLRMNHRVFDAVEAVVGEHVWNFADFRTTPGIMRVGGNKKGAFTRSRKPKQAAFELRDRWLGQMSPATTSGVQGSTAHGSKETTDE